MFNHRPPPAIIQNGQGSGKITQNPFVKQVGAHARIRTQDHEFTFTPAGEIRFIRGLGRQWPHPEEQLKRTDGNDWVYYSVGDDSTEDGVISWMGEYYLPSLPYPSNGIWDLNYRENPAVMAAFGAWSQLFADLWDLSRQNSLPPSALALIQKILARDDQTLFNRSQELKEIIGTPISVLPPDTRQVDYQVIPLIIAHGCRYQCQFCCVQPREKFQERTRENIDEQLQRLAAFYGENLENYNALFLGNQDALAAGDDLILEGIEKAGRHLGFSDKESLRPRLFLFGSVDALMAKSQGFFQALDQTAFDTWINVGLESVDGPTLKAIGKPLTPKKVQKAFEKICTLNQDLSRVELSCNFLMGQDMPPAHYQGITTLLSSVSSAPVKGSVYLSPVKGSPKKRELLPLFRGIKSQSRLPVFIYLIQRF